MSTLKVEVVLIDSIEAHPNADRLELIKISGWQVVAKKGEFKAGQKVVFLPIDAVLPTELETKLFPIESKIKLEKSRVRTIKLRGAISQGIVATLEELGLSPYLLVGDDVADLLNITKYEPPAKSIPGLMRGSRLSPKKGNSGFRKYTDIENFKHYNNLFAPEDIVWVSEKLHGTSVRYALLPTEANTFWKKLRRFLRILPEFEFCLGSRNVQLQDKLLYAGYYESNVYAKIAEQEHIREKLVPGEAIYGEIIGSGIQKGYVYGCVPGEHKFYVYDVMRDGRWLGFKELVEFCRERELNLVPFLYMGNFDMDLISELRKGDSLIGGQKVREGVVIKTVVEKACIIGRSVVKFINDEYLLREQSDFH